MRFRMELARALVAKGQTARAMHELEQAERQNNVPSGPSNPSVPFRPSRRQLHLHAARAEYHLEKGEHATAESPARSLLQGATALRSPKHVAVARLLLARIALCRGSASASAEHARSGLEGLAQLPSPLIAWRLWFVLGTAHQKLGDPNAAATAFARALELTDPIERGLEDSRLRAVWASQHEVMQLHQAAAALPSTRARI
jgi:tetratricopeptide (TPR) repeat protein